MRSIIGIIVVLSFIVRGQSGEVRVDVVRGEKE